MRERILRIALAVTAVYAVSIAISTALLWPGPDDHFGLSQLGDYLSGVFSPLAFGWFVVTVFIQLEELRLQRLDMREARAATRGPADPSAERRPGAVNHAQRNADTRARDT